MVSNPRDELDRILDDGLATYAVRDPWPELEDRILHRLHRQPSRRPAFPWAVVARPVATCLLLATATFRSEPDRIPVPIRTQPATREVKPPARSRVIATAPRVPKRAQFPTSSPLTAEERALAEFVARAPLEAHALFAEPSEPIRIQPIQIEPLESGKSEDDIL